jgi:hypothetical protein
MDPMYHVDTDQDQRTGQIAACKEMCQKLCQAERGDSCRKPVKNAGNTCGFSGLGFNTPAMILRTEGIAQLTVVEHVDDR